MYDPGTSELKLKLTYALFQFVRRGSNNPVVPCCPHPVLKGGLQTVEMICSIYIHIKVNTPWLFCPVVRSSAAVKLTGSNRAQETSDSNNIFGRKANVGLPLCPCDASVSLPIIVGALQPHTERPEKRRRERK